MIIFGGYHDYRPLPKPLWHKAFRAFFFPNTFNTVKKVYAAFYSGGDTLYNACKPLRKKTRGHATMTREQARDYIKGQLESYLQSKGINTRKKFSCLNPDHRDSDPSMSYDRTRQKAHCFSCEADYDTLDLIGIDYGLTGNALFLKAFELYNLTADNDRQGSTAAADLRMYRNQPKSEQHTHNSIHINTDTQEHDYTNFYKEAHSHITETDYPQRRGLSEEVAARFMLGYVARWTHPKAPNAPTSPRLIIPTSKHSYLARDTREELTEEQERYSKSKVGAVRMFNAKALQTATKPIFIVEGELDALSIIEVGGEAVATGSASNRCALLKLLETQKPSQPFIIAMDNDEAGNKAAQKLAEGLEQFKIPFYRLNPYGGKKDANDALIADREAFSAAISGAENIETEATEAAREAYIKTSAVFFLQDFMDGIADSVNTPYISTGFSYLDKALDGGLYEGLYIMGAISSLGKTTLILQIADQIAQSGQDVLIFSLEMARAELMSRSISRHTVQIALNSGVDSRNAKTARGITTGKRYDNYNSAERELIRNAIKAYASYADRVYISEGAGDIGAAQVRDTVNNHITFTGNTPVVIIDYLQILAPYNERATDKQNTDKAVMELKRISRDYKTPVIAISSFNRANYREAVTMEAFKESGAVEYSSDVLIGLQLKGAGGDKFNANDAKKENPRQIELVILKNRNGATGDKIQFAYYPMFNYFKEKEEI